MSLPKHNSSKQLWRNLVDTPAVLVDLNVVERNIARCQTRCDQLGFTVRPHIKTHKIPLLTQAQLNAGAIGITCQKLGEAEVMVEAGIDDILISYNIIGAAKLARLKALTEKARIIVCADSGYVVAGLSHAFADAEKPLEVMVECDTGMNRCGVTTPAEAASLAQEIFRAPGLTFSGLMTYPAAGQGNEAITWLGQAKEACQKAGLDVPVISSGGTPDLYKLTANDIITEYRPGSYIYNDRSLVTSGAVTEDDCALSVLTTIVSRPTKDRAAIDAGSKSLTSDTFGHTDFGTVLGHPNIQVASLSEEHGHLKSKSTADLGQIKVGDTLRILPNHACVVSNLFDYITFVRGDYFVKYQPVAARGAVK